jgi:uncharacterized membrane protein YfcA
MKGKIDFRLVRAYAPMCIMLVVLCLVPRHTDMPSWIKWGIGIFSALSLLNCFITLADMKKKAGASAPTPEEKRE